VRSTGAAVLVPRFAVALAVVLGVALAVVFVAVFFAGVTTQALG
jgi:hypothetical protein